MAEAFVVGQIFEALCGELVKAIREVWTKSKEFKPLLQQLESTVDRITPIFKEIESLNQAVHRPKTETAVFGEQLHEAKNLVLKCDGARWWNKSSYAKKLIEYDRSLTRFFQIDVTAQILHSVRRVEKDLAGEKKKEEVKKSDEKGKPTYWGNRPWPLPGSIPARPPPPVAPPPPPPPPPAMEPAMDIGEHPLDFLRNSPQFQALRPLLQKNPRLLELTLQGLRKKHPNIFELIEDRKDAFEELINEPVDGSDGDLSDQPEQEMPPAVNVSRAEQEMPHTISVILAEQEAIERLEEMGFDSNLVIEAFLACDGNEELAVKYLLENAGYFED